MNDGINVKAESISSMLSDFQSQMTLMETLVSEISTKTSSVKSEWEGNTSEAVLSDIDNFLKVFDDVKAQNKKYVDFLNNTINAYSQEDSSISNSVSSLTK